MYVRPYTLFSTVHPLLLLVYALGAPILTMCGRNPVFQAVACLCAVCINIFYLGGKGAREGSRGILVIFLVVSALNVILNPMGVTTICYIGTRRLTMESLCYGVSNGLMLATVILWFRSFTAILPNQKFLYLFGRRFQKTGLLLSMILKMFPETRYKIHCIQFADDTLGYEGSMSLRQKIARGMRHISVLLEWSMEDGIETADSMKARGYGEGLRTSYEEYPVTAYDKITGVVMFVTFAIALAAVVVQNREFVYYPTLAWKAGHVTAAVAGMLGQGIFFLMPLWMELQKRGKRR